MALRRSPWMAAALGLLFFCLTALGLTWPLARRLPTHLPLGTETSATVPLLNVWTLQWNAQRLPAGYQGYWDAPIFYPESGTFALADPQPATGLLFAPFFFITRNPVLSYNLVLILILALNGASAAYLLHTVMHTPGKKGDAGANQAGAALLGGLLAQSLPFVFRELGVLQLTPLFPVFLSLRSLVKFSRRPELRSALGIGFWTAFTFLSSDYYGLFLSLFLIPGGVIFARRIHFYSRSLAQLLAGGLLGLNLLLPVLPAQVRLTQGHSRSETTIRNNSAAWVDYLRLDERSWGAAAMPWLRQEGGSGQRLYPGTGLLALALPGALLGWQAGKRRWVIFCVLGAGLAFLLSAGLNLRVFGWQPYQLLRGYLPGYAQLRSPFRMAVFGQIFLAGLAGLALGGLWRWRGRAGRGLAILFVALALMEVLTPPARLWPASLVTATQDWAAWLAGQPAGAAVLIPFNQGRASADFESTTVGMLQSLQSGKPLVNGYSGFFPDSYRLVKEAMRGFPGPASLLQLRNAGTLYLLVERDWLTPERAERLEGAGLERVFEGQARVIYLFAEE